MSNKEEEIEKICKDLNIIDCLQYDPHYTANYQRAICLYNLGYRKINNNESRSDD